MKTTETQVVRACLNYLRIKNHLVARINNGAFETRCGGWVKTCDIPGFPDITGITHDGKALAVECKSSIGKLSRPQEVFKAAWIARGGLYITAKSIDDLREAGL